MRILTNLSKAELDYLTNQPTAKAMIDKVKKEGIYTMQKRKNFSLNLMQNSIRK